MTPLTKFAILAGLLGASLLGVMTATPAAAQGALMGNAPWGFNHQTSRASIAALIESQQDSSSGTTAGAGNFCGGGGGDSTATANYTCIIVNDSTAEIAAGQNSLGDQEADSVTATSLTGGEENSLSDVLQGLVN